MRIFHRIALLLLLSIAFFSCGSRKKIVYLQGIENAKSYDSSTDYEAIIQPDDVLSIIVSSDSPEIAAPFNLPEIQSNEADYRGLKTYLVDNTGYIDFPVLGKIKLGGLTRTEANNKMVTAISEYIRKPIVNLRIANFKVSVIGEVTKPGSYNVVGERVTILEALAMAGDLTIYGVRENVLVIRDKEGKKTYTRVDLTKPDLLNSPFYYLSQNDVVFVEQNKTRINNSVLGQDMYVLFSSLSLLVTLAVVLFKN
ncbi:polysaccharide export outer membrane protein [Flavobacterium noncentrifugens]|uniref:Polysaccharide export outer membrane protein n=1 Tax=Flavobacterium noncentrifugens TaxID=1128970 RepID=A0A1G8V940_9FLAO|nr:polysaccharide biosynthesis/export family protein [Flavobacterium noncentrifugens]GEP50389.1 polysaccharide export outer membrane protein [Flavobacterium noncentrifugens]SDJ62377.1 polysaccharide export outer membrane protein [Flavobacterium noncentrifugens]